jgi:uncharacterized protein (DUF1778 family)
MTDLVFDNEAVQALTDPLHPKHRVVLAHLAGLVTRRKRGRPGRAVVPTTVRVEAGWDRTRPGAAAINRFRITDCTLDAASANAAATIRSQTGVSVADSHVGAVVRDLAQTATGGVVVLTSDPNDISRAAAPVPIAVVRI